jgi:phospholipid:diacylglycerol acyltransferase
MKINSVDFRYARGEFEHDEMAVDVPDNVCDDFNASDCSFRTPLDLPLKRRTWIDAEYTDETVVPKVGGSTKVGSAYGRRDAD